MPPRSWCRQPLRVFYANRVVLAGFRALTLSAMALAESLDVLLVEDDPDIAAVYAASLRKAGWRVNTVADGLNALQSVWHKKPRLVLLDLQLPGLDGLTVLRHLHQLSTATLVIVLSNSDGRETVKSVLAGGAIGFRRKYMTTPGQLVEIVSQTLRSSRGSDLRELGRRSQLEEAAS